jgi:hypothetical protein
MTPVILKTPIEWRFEKMPVPPEFRAGRSVQGLRGSRFSPGCSIILRQPIFTYVFVLSIEGTPSLDSVALKDFLEKYYRGLGVGLARQEGQSPAPSK